MRISVQRMLQGWIAMMASAQNSSTVWSGCQLWVLFPASLRPPDRGILQVSIILFIFFLNIGIGPIPWMINGELFPEECKSASASLSTIVNWLMAFTVTKTVVYLQAVLGYSGTYFLYGSLTTLGAIYILLGVPETKGKSPEEILQYFKIGHKKTVVLEDQESKSRGDTSPDTTSSPRKQFQSSSTSMDTNVGLHV